MPHAKIHRPSGAIVTVEGTASEIAAILAQLEGPVPQSSPSPQSKSPDAEQNTRDATGPSSLVLKLKESGFFDTPRSLGDIGGALQEQGFLYPPTTLSGVLLSLLKKGKLHRKKAEGRWVYGR